MDRYCATEPSPKANKGYLVTIFHQLRVLFGSEDRGILLRARPWVSDKVMTTVSLGSLEIN